MSKQSEVEKAIKTCIAIEQSGGEFDGNRLTCKILECLEALQVVIKVGNPRPDNVEYPVAVESLIEEE